MVDAKPNVQPATLLESAHKRAAIVIRPDLASSREARPVVVTRYTYPMFDFPSRHRGVASRKENPVKPVSPSGFPRLSKSEDS